MYKAFFISEHTRPTIQRYYEIAGEMAVGPQHCVNNWFVFDSDKPSEIHRLFTSKEFHDRFLVHPDPEREREWLVHVESRNGIAQTTPA